MLSEKELKKIALEECVEMIGKELVDKHKELCCCAYGTTEDGLFDYSLGMDTEEKEYGLGDETPMKYNAYVSVDPSDGKVTRNYKHSILPK